MPTPTAPVTRTVVTPDDRDLEVVLSGPEDGFPLVHHHGTPQAAVTTPRWSGRRPSGACG